MITFYSLSKKEDNDNFWTRVNNIEATLAITLADMLNGNEKYKFNNTCNLHSEFKNQIGIVYTFENVEFIITVICCDDFKKEVHASIERLKPGLRKFFSVDNKEVK